MIEIKLVRSNGSLSTYRPDHEGSITLILDDFEGDEIHTGVRMLRKIVDSCEAQSIPCAPQVLRLIADSIEKASKPPGRRRWRLVTAEVAVRARRRYTKSCGWDSLTAIER